MPKAIRSPEIAVKNWVDRASAAASFWLDQIDRAVWKTYAGSDKAEDNFKTAMSDVIAKKKRQLGVQASSDEVWKSGAKATGSTGYSRGVAASEPRMSAVMSKLLPEIDGIRKALKPRGVRGSEDNISRAVELMKKLHEKQGTFRAKGVPKKAS